MDKPFIEETTKQVSLKLTDDRRKLINRLAFTLEMDNDDYAISDLLEKIIASGRANKVSLHYNSNGTQLPMNALKNIWPEFKYVDVHFSIDGYEKHFEYQRHPAKWQDALATMSVFKEYQKPNFDIKICHTVNIFNVFYLPEFLEWANQFGMNVYLNNLHEPKYYNISSIPYTAKVKIQKKLENYSERNLHSVINFMMNSNTQSQFNMFERHTPGAARGNP